jgi:chromate transporter
MRGTSVAVAEPGGELRRPNAVSVLQLVGYFLRLGTLGFGGPVALCGLMEKELVQDRAWVTKDEMRDAIAISQSMPGPLAIQVGIFIAYMRGGFGGAWAGGWVFILPNFVIVAALGALYVHFGGLSWMTAIFYGISPAVIALILHSCWRLAKLGMEDSFQWMIAGASFAVTLAFQAEVAVLFIVAGICGVLYYGSLFRRLPPGAMAAFAAPTGVSGGIAIGATQTASLPLLGKLLVLFLKAGALTFGSGLVIVPFLEKGLVQETNWLNPREFLVAVAIGMMSPGPVVITATFVGYLVAGFWGAAISTIGIFLPSFLMVLIVAPILLRHRNNVNVQGFVRAAYAAAIGTILGACVLLAKIAIGDWLTALIAVVCLAVPFRYKVSNPLMIGATAAVGLVAFPLLQPVWVFVR